MISVMVLCLFHNNCSRIQLKYFISETMYNLSLLNLSFSWFCIVAALEVFFRYMKELLKNTFSIKILLISDYTQWFMHGERNLTTGYHHPTDYTAEMVMCKVALHMLKHPNHFYQYVEEDLLKAGESYKSYCVNIFWCKVWRNDLIAAAFGDMWNLAVLVVSPVVKKPFHLFHTKSQLDIILVCNRGNYLKHGGSTHYNGTRSTDPDFEKHGSDLINPTLQQDMTAKLTPTVLNDKEMAKQLALNEYLKDKWQASLDLLRTVCKGIRRLDDKIATLIEQSDDLRNQKKFLVYKMEKLGVRTEQIEMYMQELGERPFCRTLECEKEDEEQKRKRQLEEDKEESKAKRTKITATVEGHENLGVSESW